MSTLIQLCGGESGVGTTRADCHTYGWHPGTGRYQLTPNNRHEAEEA